MKLKMRGKVWAFERRRMANADGQCDDPRAAGKSIFVDSRLSGERELDVIVHELTHAAHWDLAEEAVEEYATDLARALWRIGYRKK